MGSQGIGGDHALTLHPETDVIASSLDGKEFVYTIRKNGIDREVRIPAARFASIPKGPLGVPQRRAILAMALRGK